MGAVVQRLMRGEVGVADVHRWYPYSAFTNLWRHYFTLCQHTPTFTDVDFLVRPALQPLLAPSVLPASQPPSAESPSSPQPASPVPRRLGSRDAGGRVRDADGGSARREDRRGGGGGVVLRSLQVSLDEMYGMLKEAREGNADAEVRREWRRIVDATHPDVVEWGDSRSASP